MSNSARAVAYAIAVVLFLIGAFVARKPRAGLVAEMFIALGLAVAFFVPFYDAVSA